MFENGNIGCSLRGEEICFPPRSKTVEHISYLQYGDNGVTVCDRWLSFENFLQDMGERPAGKSLGRKGDVGNYEPGNVSWQNSADQVANWRSDRIRPWSKKKITEQIAA